MRDFATWLPRQRADVLFEVMPDGSALLYDPLTDAGHILMAVGALAWDMCDGAQTADAIVSAIASLLPDQPEISEIVRSVLTEFADGGLLEPNAHA
jgi:hypothetical protein